MGIEYLQKGMDYQYYLTWLKICEMMKHPDKISKVSFEKTKYKFFDDIIIEYATPDNYGDKKNIKFEYFQVKFHAKCDKTISFENLMDKRFVGNKRYSFMQRLKEAYDKNNNAFQYSLFSFYTPWHIKEASVLSKVYDNNKIDLEKFFSLKNKDKDIVKMREQLCQHMNVNEKKLKIILGSLRIYAGGKTFIELEESLNEKLDELKLRPIQHKTADEIYLNLMKEWIKDKNKDIDMEFINKQIEKNGLKELVEKIYVFSYDDDRIKIDKNKYKIFPLTQYFNKLEQRYLCDNVDWNVDIKNKINEFIKESLKGEKTYKILFSTGYSISFYMGYCTHSRTGIHMSPLQSTRIAIEDWSYNKNDLTKYENIDMAVEGSDVDADSVLIISISKVCYKDVKQYLEESNMVYSHIYNYENVVNVKNGNHSEFMVNDILRGMKKRPIREKRRKVHVFAAVPSAFMFHFGQEAKDLGKVQIYEFDFDKKRNCSYTPGIEIP